MNSEALRLLDLIALHVARHGAMDTLREAQLRALLSAQEPTTEHWRQASQEIVLRFYGVRLLSVDLAKMESHARELAKQTNCTASDDTPSKSRAKRIAKLREAK